MRPGIDSLAGRLLLASAVLLPLFLGATGLYLEHSHRRSLEAAQAERMELQVLTLLAEAEYRDGALTLPEQLIEARFNQPGSGLYGLVSGADRALLWSSPSAVTLDAGDLLKDLPWLQPGERQFTRRDGLFRASLQVLWAAATPLEPGTPAAENPENPAGDDHKSRGLKEVPLLFTVLETVDPVEAEVRSYRGSLLLWLGGSALLLVACQGAILAWGLRPLRELAADIGRVESGATEQLGGPYPREVQALTDSLDTLLQSEKARRERVRNTLTDLAHSLKTPLAVIRGADPADPEYGPLVRAQAGRMDQIVSYQLQRAAGSTHRLLQSVPVLPAAQRLRASLLKVYADKSPDIELAIDAACRFRGDERDLMEVLGNLMDNACKYGRGRVRVVAVEGEPLTIAVEDDGPGIPPDRRSAILQRGIRADLQAEGQGIGLAVAADIVASYGGELALASGEWGGARIDVRFP